MPESFRGMTSPFPGGLQCPPVAVERPCPVSGDAMPVAPACSSWSFRATTQPSTGRTRSR